MLLLVRYFLSETKKGFVATPLSSPPIKRQSRQCISNEAHEKTYLLSHKKSELNVYIIEDVVVKAETLVPI